MCAIFIEKYILSICRFITPDGQAVIIIIPTLTYLFGRGNMSFFKFSHIMQSHTTKYNFLGQCHFPAKLKNLLIKNCSWLIYYVDEIIVISCIVL